MLRFRPLDRVTTCTLGVPRLLRNAVRGSRTAPGRRTPTTALHFARLAADHGLEVTRQFDSWSDGCFGGGANDDVFTVLRKHGHEGQVTDALSGGVAVSPRWARAYNRYGLTVPNHPGKRRVMRALHGVGLRAQRPFAWRMSNGTWLAIRPEEGLLAGTVGWTCFREGCWDPHVEACIRRILCPGQTAIDAGANLGYMTAVMAQCVGPTGRVWAFEPVDETYELLELCRALNALDHVALVPVALGATNGSTGIIYDRRHSGLATMHPKRVGGELQQVPLRSLDALVAVGQVTRPALIKIDVEGHELDVLRGARATIAEASPAIVFEFNERAATAAGWTLREVAELLTSVGDYRFWLIDGDRERPLDPFTFRLERDDLSDPHVDVLARPAATPG